MNAFVGLLLRFRFAVLALVIVVTGFFGYQLLSIELNGDFSTYLSRTDPAVRQFNLVGRQYASKSIGIVVVESDDVFNAATLRLVRTLTDAYEKAPGVAYVTSLTNVLDFRKSDGGLVVSRLIQSGALPQTAAARAHLGDYVLSRDMYVGDLVSANGKETAIVVRIAHGASELGVTHAIRRITEATPTGSARVSYGGFPFMMDTMTGLIIATLERLEPVMVLLMAVILYLGFRRAGGVFIPLLVVAVSAVWAVGLMSLLGLSLNMVTGIMPIVLIALGSADAIHVMRRYYEGRERGQDAATAIRETFAVLKWPMVVTTVTTSVGFLSLAVSQFSVIQQFGLVTTLAVYLALAVTLVMIPLLLRGTSDGAIRRGAPAAGRSATWMARAAELIHRRRRWVLGIAGFIGLASLAAIPLLTTSVDWTLCFARGSAAERAEMLLRRDFGGTLPIQVLVRGDLSDPATLEVMSSLERDLNALPGVSESRSMARLLSEMNWVLNDRFTPPRTRTGVSNLWFLIEDQDVVEQLAREDRHEGLVEARLATWDTGVISHATDKVSKAVARLPRKLAVIDLPGLPPKVQAHLLGQRARRVSDDLVHVLAGQDLTVSRSRLEPVVQQFVDKAQLDDAERERARAAVEKYLASDQAELAFDSRTSIAILAEESSQSTDARGGLDRLAVANAARKLLPSAAPDDARALASSLGWVVSQTVGQYRVQRALAAITPLLPAGSLERRSLRRELAGSLWQINSNQVAVDRAELGRLGLATDQSSRRDVSLSYEVTGLAEVLQRMEQELVPTQVWSLLLALIGVAVLLALMFRSLVAGLVGIVPIALTILVNFAVMALLGVGLDSFTAMIASVAIGLGIDYAVHFLAAYRRELRALNNELDALRRTFATTGVAIIINTFTVGTGFAVLLLAPGQHVQRFGGLVALTMFLGAVFTLALLPAFTPWLNSALHRRIQDEDLAERPGVGLAIDSPGRLGADRG